VAADGRLSRKTKEEEIEGAVTLGSQVRPFPDVAGASTSAFDQFSTCQWLALGSDKCRSIIVTTYSCDYAHWKR
jgi:hypothetical protein